MRKRPDLELAVEETDGSQAQTSAAFRLEGALIATRRHFDGRSERATLTEQRILERAWPAKPRRRPLWLLPLVALFAGSIAFAHELGTFFDGARARFFSAGERSDVARPAARTVARVPERMRAAGVASSANAALEPAAPLADGAAVRGPARVTARAKVPEPTARAALDSGRHAAPTSGAPSMPEPSAPGAPLAVDHFTLYRNAHRAHFADRDYAAALTAWDRYLATAPHGSFAPEARYNRALALYRLARNGEAIAALRPFAQGAYGRYRQDEARRLLESLESLESVETR